MDSSPTQHNVNMAPRSSRKSSLKNPRRDVVDQTREIQDLQNDILQKDAALSAMATRVQRLESEVISLSRASTSSGASRRTSASARAGADSVMKRHHPLTHIQHVISDKGRTEGELGRSSLATSQVLDQLAASEREAPCMGSARALAKKFIEVFSNPSEHISYIKSHDFAAEILELCDAVCPVFEKEPRCLFLQSPSYVIGDIHGNLEDLHFFADNLWKLGMDLSAGKFLFLGDYVDRGLNGIECIAYLFGLKLLYPQKVFLLRGNHEVRDVNGWEEHYGEKSFIYQCKMRFGTSVGSAVWEKVNEVFDRMALAAVIDHDIFCIHGGIPRPLNSRKAEITSILEVPKVASVMPPSPSEPEDMQQVCLDCLWSDPAPEEMEPSLGSDGFGESPRGGGAICFGNNAIDNFLTRNQLSYIIRAHEAHAHGVSLSKSARVFTVFSTSKDHRQGAGAMAGCVLVDVDTIKVINRSPKYKNKYVHRRESLSLQGLTANQLEERRRLGLVRYSMGEQVQRIQEADDEEEDEEEGVTSAFAAVSLQEQSDPNSKSHSSSSSSSSKSSSSSSAKKQTQGQVDGKKKGSGIFHSFVPTWLSESI